MDRQIEQLTVAKLGEMPEPNQGASIATAPSHAKSGTCIERLQQEIARLLFKNQIIRFELLAAQQKIARIDQELFGAGIGDLEKLLSPDRVRSLRDLCRTAEPEMPFVS